MEDFPVSNKQMMKDLIFSFRHILVSVILLPCLFSCDAWKDDLVLTDANYDKKLAVVIALHPEISRFDSILKITGYDKLLEGEQSLTVFAPTNEALKNLDVSSVDYLKKWVENYMAYTSYYVNSTGSFAMGDSTVTEVEMLNDKIIPINIQGITKNNIAAGNGVLHIINYQISFRKNLLEYIYEQQGYDQIDFIKSIQEKVMDPAKSIQTGVDINGQPLFDTVWTEKNTFLESYRLGNEKMKYTVILLDNSALALIKQKYAKYMYQANTVTQNKEIMKQLCGDLVLKYVNIKSSGRYPSVGNVLVDIDTTRIINKYECSNGMVYKLSAADIKIYENKIKTQVIEGEDYTGWYDGQNAWTVRYRSWASGGKDVMLKGDSKCTFSYIIHLPTKDSTATASKTFIYTGDSYVQSKTTNAYVQYNPVLYSCDYEIYWVANDDVASHNFTTPTGIIMPMPLEQKLLISFPGMPELKRESDGKITNNFSLYSAMAATTYAGIPTETKLVRYRLNADNNTSGSTNERLFLLDVASDGVDAFGSGSIIKCPAYGKATFFVGNTTRAVTSYAGLIFLDYIKLVPKVDIND